MLSTIRNVFLTLFIAGIVSCILLPPIWGALHLASENAFGFDPGIVFKRIWMIGTVLALILARNHIGLQHPAKAGFTLQAESARNVVLGVLVAWLFLYMLSACYVLGGVWQTHPDYSFQRLAKKFYTGLFRGTLVALIEEYIFRGLIFLSFCRKYSWKTAAFLSSAIFASLHFLDARTFDWTSEAVGMLTGFEICGTMLYHMFAQFALFPDAFGLFIIGWILCYSFYATGSLWYGIGLHGGWVWFAAYRGGLFAIVDHSQSFYYGGAARIFDGIAPILGMLIIFPITYGLLRWNILHRQPESIFKAE